MRASNNVRSFSGHVRRVLPIHSGPSPLARASGRTSGPAFELSDFELSYSTYPSSRIREAGAAVSLSRYFGSRVTWCGSFGASATFPKTNDAARCSFL